MAEHPVVPGFRWGGIEAGIRKRGGRPDLALLLTDEPVACAGIFTRSDAAAAPVVLSRPKATAGRARAVLMNAGCANACTGEKGAAAAHRMAAALTQLADIPEELVLIASTGVIGAHLPVERIEAHLGQLVSSARPDGIREYARAIMTTDTREKVASRQGFVAGRTVTVAGTCKGAGMIMPDMATMLACVVTDAAVEPEALRTLIGAAAWPSFNAVTVDGDTSTNDTLYLLASGQAGNPVITRADSPGYSELLGLVRETCIDLAKQIAADGEGATKFIEVHVSEARTEDEADTVARRIANSPLVKTALHAADANWGRIVAAIGVCGFSIDASRIALQIEDVLLVEHGQGLGVLAEEHASARMRGPAFTLHVRLGRGAAERSIFTCDYSAEYVKINAEYRT
jgi:glutamate N-acetyltransferase/amino-acid N-acetyltransferase